MLKLCYLKQANSLFLAGAIYHVNSERPGLEATITIAGMDVKLISLISAGSINRNRGIT